MRTTGTPHPHPQRLAAAGVLLFVCSLPASCEAPQTTPKAPPQALVTSAVPTTSPSVTSPGEPPAKENPDLGGTIKLGMSYAQLSSSLRSMGWTPVTNAECKANVIGDNHQELCRAHPELAKCGVCDQVPGLSSCSGRGDCLLLFAHQPDGKSLEVGMSGDIGSWNAPGPDATFYVSGWRYRLKSGD